MARLFCRIFGHRLERIYILGRVGALVCSRCEACTRFPCPGVTDEQVDRVFPR
jgi:hypothetical protein